MADNKAALTAKLYPEHDPSKLEPHYSQHVAAMTAEALYSKHDIAIQLAARDKRIAELENELAWAKNPIKAFSNRCAEVAESARAARAEREKP